MPESADSVLTGHPGHLGHPGDRTEGPGDRRRLRARARWLVHLFLLIAFAGSLLALVFTTGLTLHILVGAAFVALASVHVWQRRRTVHTLVSHLAGITRLVKLRGQGHKVGLPVGYLGLPAVFVPWHVVSALALSIYLTVHVVRRWPRLRTSSIR